MICAISRASPALTSMSSASGTPRSAYGLPLLCSMVMVSMLAFVFMRSLLFPCRHNLQPSLDQFHIRLGRGNAVGGLLLETVQDIDRPGIPYRVDRSVCAALIILHHLQHARSAEALQRLGLQVLLSGLGQVQCVAESVLHITRHRTEIFLG